MGRLSRIAKAVMRELHFERTTAVEIPVPTGDVSLDGKLALITGGTSGIGLECARAFAARGCSVIVAGRNQGKIDDALKELPTGKAAGMQINVRDVTSLEARVEEAAQLFPGFSGIDILVNAAGIMKCPHIDDIDRELWDAIIETNLRAPSF
ncbi:MAG: SDR family NAD(P)-dependent oxidoreductase [Collinsella sp.]